MFKSSALSNSSVSHYPYLQLKNVTLLLFNRFSANPTKWPNTLKQFVGNFPTNCLSVFYQFVGLALISLYHNILCILPLSHDRCLSTYFAHILRLAVVSLISEIGWVLKFSSYTSTMINERKNTK